MKVLIVNVTHWIGYHLTNWLLDEGYEVKGVKRKGGNDSLIDFFGRNSNFQLIEATEPAAFRIAFCIECSLPDNMEVEKCFQINGSQPTNPAVTQLHATHLFGEWMPLSDEDINHLEEGISSKGEDCREELIYIEDFLKALSPEMEEGTESKDIYFHSERKKMEKTLEKSISVHENVPIEETFKQVIRHYEQFQELYPRIDG